MKKMISPFLLAGCFALALTACFSPWAGDDGELRISLGNQGLSRQLVNIGTPYEPDTFTYELILKGPGGTRRFDFDGASAVVKVVPGNYQVTVRALGDPNGLNLTVGVPIPNPFPAGTMILRAFGEQEVTVRGGAAVPVSIDMTSAMEVTNWDQLDVACSQDANSLREEIIFIKNSFSTAGTSNNGISIVRSITLRAERPVTITAVSIMPNLFRVNSGATLNLKGPLTLDGGGPNHTHTGPAVQINNGTFSMTGSTISNYRAGGSSAAGGVNISASDGGTAAFTMTGSTISNCRLFGSGAGGVDISTPVGVSGGTAAFTMIGSTISNCSVSGGSAGGGVYLHPLVGGTAAFTMTGGSTISNCSVSGGGTGGVSIFAPAGSTAAFTISGGSITGNTTDSPSAAGGVYVSGGTLNIVSPATPGANGSIRGNMRIALSSNVVNYGGTVSVNGVPLSPLNDNW